MIRIRRLARRAAGAACLVWALLSIPLLILAVRQNQTLTKSWVDIAVAVDSVARNTHSWFVTDDPASLHFVGFSPGEVPEGYNRQEVKPCPGVKFHFLHLASLHGRGDDYTYALNRYATKLNSLTIAQALWLALNNRDLSKRIEVAMAFADGTDRFYNMDFTRTFARYAEGSAEAEDELRRCLDWIMDMSDNSRYFHDSLLTQTAWQQIQITQ